MSHSEPGVTLVVACYNCADYVAAALDSVARQDYANITLIVADDASTDKTGDAIVAALLSTGLEAQRISNEHNKGVCATFNSALARVRTPYVMFLSGDDWIAPERVSKQVAVLEAAGPHVAMVYTDMFEVNAGGEVTPGRYAERHPGDWGRSDDLYRRLLARNWIPAPSAMARTESLREVGGYDEALPVEDHDMWLRLARRFDFAYLAEPLTYYRRHPSSLSTELVDRQRRRLHEGRLRMLEKHLGGRPDVEEIVRGQLYAEARLAYRFGSRGSTVRGHFAREVARAHSPRAALYWGAATLGLPGPLLVRLASSVRPVPR